MPRVVHFELSVDDPGRAVAFYRSVFGWKIDKWEGPEDYWLVTTGQESEPGINGALARRSELLQGTQNSIDVASVDETIAKITESGGKALMPKTPIPGIGYFASCQDAEGNIFGIMESNPSVTG